MKYIRFTHVGFVLFEETMAHSDMARRVNDTVVSAGLVNMDELNPPRCHGTSLTLGVSPAPDDTMILQRRLGLGRL